MKKIVLGCVGVTVLGVVVCGGLISFWLFVESPTLDATLSLPAEVRLGSSVEMVVTATNPHEEPVALDSIDVDDSFLAGFQVVAIDPEPIDTMHIFGQRSWEFGQSVAPGDSIVVRFELKAVGEGHFSGDVDVCNPKQDFKTLVADVVVKGGPLDDGIDGARE